MEDDPSLLTRAILTGDIPEIQSLINANVITPKPQFWTLWHACLFGIDMIQALLTSPDITFNIEFEGHSLLEFLLRTPNNYFSGKKSSIIHFLIKNGADPLKPNGFGETPLHVLTRISRDEETFSKGLLSTNASLPSLDLQNCLGCTALKLAIEHHHYNTARVEAGANPGIGDELDVTAIGHAVQEGAESTAKR